MLDNIKTTILTNANYEKWERKNFGKRYSDFSKTQFASPQIIIDLFGLELHKEKDGSLFMILGYLAYNPLIENGDYIITTYRIRAMPDDNTDTAPAKRMLLAAIERHFKLLVTKKGVKTVC